MQPMRMHPHIHLTPTHSHSTPASDHASLAPACVLSLRCVYTDERCGLSRLSDQAGELAGLV